MKLGAPSGNMFVGDGSLWKRFTLTGTITEIPTMGFASTISNSIRKGRISA